MAVQSKKGQKLSNVWRFFVIFYLFFEDGVCVRRRGTLCHRTMA